MLNKTIVNEIKKYMSTDNKEILNKLVTKLEEEILLDNAKKVSMTKKKQAKAVLKYLKSVKTDRFKGTFIGDNVQYFTNSYTAFALKDDDIIEGLAEVDNDTVSMIKRLFQEKPYNLDDIRVDYASLKTAVDLKEERVKLQYDTNTCVVFNSKYLFDLATILGYATDFIIELNDKPQASYVTNDEGSVGLILPIRIKDDTELIKIRNVAKVG